MFTSIKKLANSVFDAVESVADITVETVGIGTDLLHQAADGIKEFREEINNPEPEESMGVDSKEPKENELTFNTEK